jgi:hypothetical protein
MAVRDRGVLLMTTYHLAQPNVGGCPVARWTIPSGPTPRLNSFAGVYLGTEVL